VSPFLTFGDKFRYSADGSPALLLTDYTCCCCFAWGCGLFDSGVYSAFDRYRSCLLVHRSLICDY
jgi:hypothetical protein